MEQPPHLMTCEAAEPDITSNDGCQRPATAKIVGMGTDILWSRLFCVAGLVTAVGSVIGSLVIVNNSRFSVLGENGPITALVCRIFGWGALGGAVFAIFAGIVWAIGTRRQAEQGGTTNQGPSTPTGARED